jgi:peptidoglycan-associated lipoprotein
MSPNSRSRSTKLLGFALGAAITVGGAQEARPCGLKPPLQTVKGHRRVTRSVNPSRVLIVGEADSLEKGLKQAGHVVRRVDDVSEARGQLYDVVMVRDSREVRRAQSACSGAKVIVRERRPSDNYALVEQTVAAPVAVRENHVPIGSTISRTPVDSGGSTSRSPDSKLVNAGSNDPIAPRSPEPVRVATPEPAEPIAPAAIARAIEPEAKVEAPKERPAKTALELRFALGSAELTAPVKAALAADVRWLRAHPRSKLIVEGHTDAIGPSEYNLSLGERRARSAKKYLVAMGADPDRVEIVSFGEEKPSHEPPENPKNRRVIVVRD